MSDVMVSLALGVASVVMGIVLTILVNNRARTKVAGERA